MALRKLSRSEWDELDRQYQNTPPLNEGFSASGEHYVLVHILNKFGFHPKSREEAMKLAEELLANGWKDD
ncbi:MAG: hypothetical protein AAB427_09095 [Chloroflexota bacterium]